MPDDGEQAILALKTYAATLQKGLEFASRKPSKLRGADFPCLIVLDNGGGVVGLSRTGNTLKIFTSAGTQTISAKALDDIADRIGFMSPMANDETTAEDENDGPKSGLLGKSGLVRLGRLVVANNKMAIGQIMMAAAVSNALMIALPLFIMTVYDRVIPHGAVETLWALAIGVLIALAADVAIRFVRAKLNDAASMGTSLMLQGRLFSRLTNARMAKTPTAMADWTNAFRDVDSATALVPGLIAGVLIDLPFVVLVLLLVQSMAGPVVWAPIVGIALFAVWTFTSAIVMRRTGAVDIKAQNARMEVLSESASLARTVKVVGAQPFRSASFQQLMAGAVPDTHRLRLFGSMQPQVTMMAVQAVIVISVIIGVFQIIDGMMTVGALAATTLLIGRILMPVGQLMMLIARAFQVSPSMDRVFHLLDLPQETAGDTEAQRTVQSGLIELTNVSYAFPNTATPSLSDISVSIKPGEKVALIGRSGSGKSTLLQLMVRLYDADSGRYLIDSHDARQFAPQTLRQSFAYMPQEAELFDGTVYQNLMIANPAATQVDIEAALVAAGASDFIRHHPEGLSCPTGARGARLSGGERQAVCLARTLLAPSRVVILDEPTASMDNTTEANVIKALRAGCADKTLIMATHRAQVLNLVDRVILMDGGRILADGPRHQVLAMLQKTG